MIVIIAVSATGEWALLRLASAGAMIMVLVKSITVREVFHSTEPRVLLTIISSFGIGQALLVTGLASWIASGIVSATVGGGSFVCDILMY